VTEQGDPLGDRLMQVRACFVMAKRTLERFGVDDLEELFRKTRHVRDISQQYKIVPFEQLTAGLDNQHTLLEDGELSPMELLVITVLRRAQWPLLAYADEYRVLMAEYDVQFDRVPERRLCVGVSKSSNGWTDGRTYVAVARDFIQKHGDGLASWPTYGLLLIHEYCHVRSDTTTEGRLHSPQFYESFHNWSHRTLGRFVDNCLLMLPRVADGMKKHLTRKQLRSLDRTAKADEASNKLAASAAAMVTTK